MQQGKAIQQVDRFVKSNAMLVATAIHDAVNFDWDSNSDPT